MKIWQTSLIFLVLFCTLAFAQQKGTFKDARDGKTYKTTKIDEQVWMAENLDYKTSSGSWGFGNSAYECDKCGRLYDWNTAITACPSGWHLPSRQEWHTTGL